MDIMKAEIGRRDFLACASITTAGVAFLPLKASSFPGQLKRRGPANKIIVIGAGLDRGEVERARLVGKSSAQGSGAGRRL